MDLKLIINLIHELGNQSKYFFQQVTLILSEHTIVLGTENL